MTITETTAPSSLEDYVPDFEVVYPTVNVNHVSKVKVISFGDPYSAPGMCICCRSTLDPGKKFVDFGEDIEWYGAVYFCIVCLSETFDLLRYFPVDGEYHTKLFNGYTRAVAEVARLRKELAQQQAGVVKHVVDSLRSYIDTIAMPAVSTGTMASISESIEQNVKSVSSGATTSNSGSSTDGSTSRSSNEQGSTDVFDLTELEKLTFDDFKL